MKERESLIINLLEEVEPMPELNSVIDFLKYYEGKKAIATSSHRKYVNIILEKFGILDLFDVIVTEEDIVNLKSHPEIFLHTSKRLGTNKNECIVIEDSANGMLAAKTASMKVIAIKNNKFDTFQDLNSADIVLNNLGELKNTIKRLNSD